MLTNYAFTYFDTLLLPLGLSLSCMLAVVTQRPKLKQCTFRRRDQRMRLQVL